MGYELQAKSHEQQIKSHKDWSNILGGKQVYNANYYETYAPVVTWFAIPSMIIIAVTEDFMQAYAQATKSCGVYMELPPGIRTKQEKSKDYVLKLLKNLQRQKQAGCIWNQYMTDKFKDTGFSAVRN